MGSAALDPLLLSHIAISAVEKLTSGKLMGIFSRVLLSSIESCLKVLSCELSTSDKPYNAKPPMVNLPATLTSVTAILDIFAEYNKYYGSGEG